MGSTTALVSHRYFVYQLQSHVVHSSLKMRAGFLLLLVVSAVLVSQSEAGWFRRAARSVVSWARKNCHINLQGAGCKWTHTHTRMGAHTQSRTHTHMRTIHTHTHAHGCTHTH